MLTETDRSDIRMQYSQAADRRKQIEILTELYACSKAEILDIIELVSEKDAPTKPAAGTSKYSKYTQSKVIEAVITQGLTNRQAASKFDVAISVVGKWISAYRKEHGIPYAGRTGEKINQEKPFINEEFDKLFSIPTPTHENNMKLISQQERAEDKLTQKPEAYKTNLRVHAETLDKAFNLLMEEFDYIESVFPVSTELREQMFEYFTSIDGFIKGLRFAESL